MDDGEALGSIENEECRIDGISQSWSVISKAGDNDKKYISMESLGNHLVDRENGIIKLLDPPFEKSKLEPGYIKGYLPGVRENGGQYTHECCCYNQFLHRVVHNCVLALLFFKRFLVNVQKSTPSRISFSNA
ncbi:MAG: GH36-type glycosyl hydrolase domain-containing protein [Clostridia bacterium]